MLFAFTLIQRQITLQFEYVQVSKVKLKVKSVYLRNLQLQRAYKNNDLTVTALDDGQRWLVLNPILNNKHQVIKIHMLDKLCDLKCK